MRREEQICNKYSEQYRRKKSVRDVGDPSARASMSLYGLELPSSATA